MVEVYAGRHGCKEQYQPGSNCALMVTAGWPGTTSRVRSVDCIGSQRPKRFSGPGIVSMRIGADWK
jgi:hypothetical protein